MNSTIASCGHYVPAVGFEGSLARRRCENEPCSNCRDADRDKMAGNRVRIARGDDARIVGLEGIIERRIAGSVVEFRADDGSLWRTSIADCVLTK